MLNERALRQFHFLISNTGVRHKKFFSFTFVGYALRKIILGKNFDDQSWQSDNDIGQTLGDSNWNLKFNLKPLLREKSISASL